MIGDDELRQALLEMEEEISRKMVKTERDIDAALAKGNEVTIVMCLPSVKIGDIIEIVQIDEDEIEKEEEGSTEKEEVTAKARVISVLPVTLVDPDTKDIVHMAEALVERLQDDQLVDLDSFHELYGDDSSKSETRQEITETVQEEETLCTCGADKIACNKSQDLFGVHINN